jgi:uncharacterized protein YegP (UPF0339 family)
VLARRRTVNPPIARNNFLSTFSSELQDPSIQSSPTVLPKLAVASGAGKGLDTRAQLIQPRGGRMAAKFVLKKGSTGKFSFSLVATNGQVIATSEAYESKASAINGIESVKRNAPAAEIDDQTDK